MTAPSIKGIHLTTDEYSEKIASDDAEAIFIFLDLELKLCH